MGKYSIDQVKDIILTNPNKHLLDLGRKQRTQLMMHVHGVGMKEALKRRDYWEGQELYQTRKEYAISNKDLFRRLLAEEDQVFTTRGGSVQYNLTPENEKRMNMLADNVQYGVSLLQWVRNFALNAYRCDPMSVILMEAEVSNEVGNGGMGVPKCYPTYKSTEEIFDYLPNGRQLEYVCFTLSYKQLAEYGIVSDVPVGNLGNKRANTGYYRFIDDEQDTVYKIEGGSIVIATMTQKNPLKHAWSRTPAFIVSDIMRFDEPMCFSSPLEPVAELADAFFYDRSVRDLSKNYHGFAKAIEPLLKCSSCKGEGKKSGEDCPECKGTGYKTRTKYSDVAKFPIEILEKVPSFSFEKLFGYVAPPIDILKHQNQDLIALEYLINATHWCYNITQMSGISGTGDAKDTKETATKTLTNLQGKYSRLNSTADWAEKTQKMIADYIGEYWFSNQWKGASISYGRNYILETPQDLAQYYYDMCRNGAPDSLKDDALERYIRSLYQNNPVQQAKYLKLIKVIPFPHNTVSEVEASAYIPLEDKLAKRYGGEWQDTVSEIYIIETPLPDIRKALREFVTQKGITEPEEVNQN
jgi:hypothetical protein